VLVAASPPTAFDPFEAVMAERDDVLQTRRFESLSNTIFGVAMTLLAYDFPREKLGGAAPNWSSINQIYAPHLLALLLSFIVAGMFWFSHQRRLGYATGATRAAALVNLLFLLSIVVLPVTTGLYGAYSNAEDVTALYGLHLLLIALLNLVLWWMAVKPRRDWRELVAPTLAATIFFAGAIMALIAPFAARFVWPLAFLVPMHALAQRRSRSVPAKP
jgi:uncharacterized membrane protein